MLAMMIDDPPIFDKEDEDAFSVEFNPCENNEDFMDKDDFLWLTVFIKTSLIS